MASKVAGFFNDIKLEMFKVSWPTKNELIGSTIIVMVSLIILSVFIGICDWILSGVVNLIMSQV